MSDSQFDEIFKNRLPGHESPVPDDMWERIVRKKDKDGKGFFFFFKLSGLFLLGFGIGYILLFGINKNPSEGQKNSIAKDATVPATTDAKSIEANRKETAASATTGTKLIGPNPAKGSSVRNEIAQDSINSVQKNYRSKSYPGGTAGKRNKSVGIPSAKSKRDSASRIQEEAVAAEINSQTDKKANSTSSSNSESLSADSANKAAIIKSEPGSNIITADTAIKPVVKKTDSTKKTESKWSLDLYASPDYPIYGEPWAKGKLSYTAGLRINRSFGIHFSGRIGVQFSQINLVIADSNVFSGSHHIKSLDLPVLAGYSWGNETLGMTVNAGVVFNLYTWPPDDQNYFKTNTGLSLYLGFSVKKKINERIDIFTEPYYRYRLSPMTVSTVYYLKFIDVAGLSFGIRYHFKK